MMELLLLQDIRGIGKKNDLIVVGDGYALNCLLPRNAALVATPMVRKRYAEHIKRRAEERERESQILAGASDALRGKSITITRKATKTGKLYAAVSEEVIVQAVKDQLGMELSSSSIEFDEHIKTVGRHDVTIVLGGQKVMVTVVIEAEIAKK